MPEVEGGFGGEGGPRVDNHHNEMSDLPSLADTRSLPFRLLLVCLGRELEELAGPSPISSSASSSKLLSFRFGGRLGSACGGAC